MQLLKITTIPMQYTIEMEAAKLEVEQADKPVAQLHQTLGEFKIRSSDIKVNIDTSRARNSLGFRTNGEFAKDSAAYGKKAGMDATAQYVQMGNKLAQSGKSGSTVAQIVSEQIKSSVQPNLVTAFLPSVGADITWQAGELSTRYQPAQLSTDWQIQKNVMNYVPGKFKMNISQYPSVKIEYTGDPMYVPPSANPNYQGEK